MILLFAASQSVLESNAFGQTEVSQSPILPHEIVLLDNGGMLQGQITRTADQVHVQAPQGSRIVLPAKRVERIFDSMKDVWQHRNAKLTADDVQGHLSLLHWCLKHQLADQARQQLNHLMETDIDVRRLKYLDQKIVRAFEEPNAQRAKENAVAKSPAQVDPFDLVQSFTRLPPLDLEDSVPTEVIVDRAIALASHSEPVASKEGATVSRQATQGSATTSLRKELKSITDLLARDDLHEFQRRVQPVVLRGCLAAKCHHSQAAVMPLMHRGRGQLVPKRFTQRNLQAILPWIDAEAVVDSRLLTRATTSHGGQKSPAMQLDSTEYERLSKWVQAVAENSPELTSASKMAESDPAESSKTVGKPDRHISIARNEHVVAEPAATVTRSVAEPTSSVDPFDPAAFNQLPK